MCQDFFIQRCRNVLVVLSVLVTPIFCVEDLNSSLSLSLLVALSFRGGSIDKIVDSILFLVVIFIFVLQV